MSEDLKDTDLKQNPGTGKAIFFVLCVCDKIHKMLLPSELCHSKIHVEALIPTAVALR